MKRDSGKRPGFLTRLHRDQKGNAMAILGAALVPIAGMIGSGLDMSRAYMAKAKLQTACDAAALATRRYMAGSSLNDAARDEGRKFFYFNFPNGTMGTGTITPSITTSANDASEVVVSASSTVPTTIMKLFGMTTIPISANCNADQDYVNNDIMLVLDVTLSMNCAVGSSAGRYCPAPETNSRISVLRNAGANLYAALEGATNVRTRYGFMPYSLTVNVGRSLPAPSAGAKPNWVREPARYWRNNNGNWSFSTATHNATWFSSSWNGCIEERSSIGTSDSNNNPRIVNAVSQADIDTVSASTAALQWQPYDPAFQQADSGLTGLASMCPQPATRLTEFATRSAFDTAFRNSLTSVGGYTFHDIGMMWGMRFLSTTGMFSADNPSMWAVGSNPAMRVDKHIVFFTDGELEVNRQTYSAYGVDERDNRMASAAGSQQEAKHRAHFLSSCNRARAMGMTVWVIALDVNATDDIRPCASGDDHFYISDGTDLDEIFTLIGKGIGKLRITR